MCPGVRKTCSQTQVQKAAVADGVVRSEHGSTDAAHHLCCCRADEAGNGGGDDSSPEPPQQADQSWAKHGRGLETQEPI